MLDARITKAATEGRLKRRLHLLKGLLRLTCLYCEVFECRRVLLSRAKG